MQVPAPVKIVVNMGVGRATQQRSLLDGAVTDLTIITGQKPVVTKAKKSIAGFKLREGNEIGAKVTLRGDRMWEFFDRLVSLAIPRIRDFRGMPPEQFDGHGNYTFGLTEQLVFPEIDYDKIDSVRGMNITIVTTAETDDQGRALLRSSGSRSAATGRGERMAKKALIEKQQRTPKFKVRGVHALPALRPAARGVPRVRSVPDLSARDGARGRDPRRDEGSVVTGGLADDNDRPDRRHADPYPQRERRDPRRRRDAVVEAEGSRSRSSSSARATSRASKSRPTRADPGSA